MQIDKKPYSETTNTIEVKKENNEYKALHAEETESNLPTPLMFSRCSSLGSLASFEQPSIQEDHCSTISDISSRPSGIISPSLNLTESSKSKGKLQMSENINSSEHQKDEDNNVHKKINNRGLKDISFQYDPLFKKPYFLKHSVFEDDIAAFKDESSPTIASSLSSLTIDDEDYYDHTVQNKAGLIKKKSNSNCLPEIKNVSVEGSWFQNPIGSTCEPLHTSKVFETRKGSKIKLDKYPANCVEKQTTSEKMHKCTPRTSLEVQYQKQKDNKMNELEWNSNSMKKKNLYPTNKQYYTNTQQVEFVPHENKDFHNSKLNGRYSSEDEFKNIQSSSEKYNYSQNIQSDHYNKYVSSGNRNEKCKGQLTEENKFPQSCHKIYNDKHNYIIENNDLNAYEEQLLDQCIRKGMAKITKRNINDIKPFCWDLNQICLTTRAMLKQREEIVKDRKDECNKRYIFPKGLTKYTSNYKFK